MHFLSVTAKDVLSFRSEVSTGDLARITVVIGKNNTGKSNLLKVLAWFRNSGEFLPHGNKVALADAFVHHLPDGDGPPTPRFSVQIALDQNDLDLLSKQARSNPHSARLADQIAALLERGLLIEYDSSWDASDFPHRSIRLCDGTGLEEAFGTASSAEGLRDSLTQLRHQFRQWLPNVMAQNTVYLSGWRTIDEPRTNGQAIIRALHTWKSPPSAERHLRQMFERVARVFVDLTGLEGAELIPRSDGGELNIQWAGRYLPITSFGDGFRHLLILAFELVTKESGIFLLEELETHLHPEVQRRLLAVAQQFPRAQFVLTSHSPVLLDARGAGLVLRMTHDGKSSSLERCTTSEQIRTILDQLDARPSDILQANVVIWVEGPSDRVFLRRCFELIASGLQESVHYQFAYYAGALRSHVAVGEANPALIDVMRLGRHIVMIADSDKRASTDAVGREKLRLKDETERAGGVSWITQGREIENYVSSRAASTMLRRLTGKMELSVEVSEFGAFGDFLRTAAGDLPRGQKWLGDYEGHKFETISEVSADMNTDDIDTLDLRAQLDRIVRFVRSNNGME